MLKLEVLNEISMLFHSKIVRASFVYSVFLANSSEPNYQRLCKTAQSVSLTPFSYNMRTKFFDGITLMWGNSTGGFNSFKFFDYY